jgi:protein-tyrosine phosphatase
LIDIHCHILAGMDDGPQRLEVSLSMAALAAEDGIKAIIATPHTDGIRVNRPSVEDAVRNLQDELIRLRIPLKIAAGFEIPYELADELAGSHTLAASNYVLLELPHYYVPADALQTVSRLLGRGLIPVIAHPERNSGIMVQPDRLAELVDAGALTQVTASSITGDLGPDTRRCAFHLLGAGLVHFIATDSHSPTFRVPRLKKARALAAKLVGPEQADALVSGNPAKILHDHS